MKGFICGALLCSLAGIPFYATVQSTPTHATGTGADSPSATQATLATSDQKFFKKATIGGMSEVAAGQLASQQGTDPGVKAFDQPIDRISSFGHGTDMKRPAQPEEISPAYVFLAAPVCSSYLTGVILPIMGGVTGSA
nr:DUF4142 domain-containing protein [Nevskia soli]